VEVEHGAELVKGPYVAETFPVSVEEDYLVIDI
jgi:3-phenylpropionate/trans-cinnamate dioxygenase ferredoxin subunit